MTSISKYIPDYDGIVVLSLFDGMSCGQQALERQGIKVKAYYALEVDKYAISVTQHNYPDTIQLGSVVDVDGSKLPKIDLLIGGSPCQSFSFAGKRKGMVTKSNTEILTLDNYLQLKQEGFEFEGQSYLFWEYMRLLHEVKPKYFLLENVCMGKKWQDILSRAIGVEPICINSAMVSAQSRKRLYWTNIGAMPSGLFGCMVSAIQQPKDRGVLLRDILEKDVPKKYYLSEKMLKYFGTRAANFNNGKVNVRDLDDKATTLTASMCAPDISDNFVCVNVDGKSSTDKCGAILSRYSKGASRFGSDPFIMEGDIICLDTRPGANVVEYGSRIKKNILIGEQKSFVSKDNLIIQLNTSTESNNAQPYQQNRVYSVDGISPAIMAGMGGRGHAILEKSPCLHGFEHGTNGQLNKQVARGGMLRRLTPTECERLQTVKDGYTSIVSDTQRYRMLGNGWTVDVIAHIFSYIK